MGKDYLIGGTGQGGAPGPGANYNSPTANSAGGVGAIIIWENI
jgi:hypothetical protein